MLWRHGRVRMLVPRPGRRPGRGAGWRTCPAGRCRHPAGFADEQLCHLRRLAPQRCRDAARSRVRRDVRQGLEAGRDVRQGAGGPPRAEAIVRRLDRRRGSRGEAGAFGRTHRGPAQARIPHVPEPRGRTGEVRGHRGRHARAAHPAQLRDHAHLRLQPPLLLLLPGPHADQPGLRSPPAAHDARHGGPDLRRDAADRGHARDRAGGRLHPPDHPVRRRAASPAES
ncbi:hypothetical protein ABH935_004924 [Catenulispora sp. GAS73]